MCACALTLQHTHGSVCACMPYIDVSGQLVEVGSPFHHVDPGDQTQVRQACWAISDVLTVSVFAFILLFSWKFVSGWLDGVCLQRGFIVALPGVQKVYCAVLCWWKRTTWRLLDYAGGVKSEPQIHVKLSVCFASLFPGSVSPRS